MNVDGADHAYIVGVCYLKDCGPQVNDAFATIFGGSFGLKDISD